MNLDNNEKIYVFVLAIILMIIFVSLPMFFNVRFGFLKVLVVVINIFLVPCLIISFIPWRK